MNATRQRPDNKPSSETSSSLAGCGSRWVNGWCSADTRPDRPDRRIQHTRVAEDRRKNTTIRYQDGKPPVVRVSSRAIKNCMRRKIVKWVNDPNVLLPTLAFMIITFTTMMAKAGVL